MTDNSSGQKKRSLEGQVKGIKDTPPLKKNSTDKNNNQKESKDRKEKNEVKVKKVKKVKKTSEPVEDDEVDDDLKAELAALVRQCAAANPEAMEEEGEEGGEGVEDVVFKDKKEKKEKPSKRQPLRAATAATAVTAAAAIITTTQRAVHQYTQQPSSSSHSDSKHNHTTTNYTHGTHSTNKDTSNGQWNFTVDYNDHFETPLVAYSDILPMLLTLAESLGKRPEDLVIYDPYYCQGGMVEMLKKMGFPKVRKVRRRGKRKEEGRRRPCSSLPPCYPHPAHSPPLAPFLSPSLPLPPSLSPRW